MFPRSSNPLVSVLLPTRGRPKHLCEAIDSLYSLAHDKSLIEFILKIDNDDLETIDVSNKLSAVLPLKSIISPRGNGYLDMHHWVNNMCAMAKGDWLFLFNDDARMATQNWDQYLLQAFITKGAKKCDGNDVCMLTISGTTEFMFLRRKVYEILGHYSLLHQCDTWIYSVMSTIHSAFTFPSISVKHLSGTIADDTRQGVEETYCSESAGMISAKSIKEKIKDAEKLIDYIGDNDITTNPVCLSSFQPTA